MTLYQEIRAEPSVSSNISVYQGSTFVWNSLLLTVQTIHAKSAEDKFQEVARQDVLGFSSVVG